MKMKNFTMCFTSSFDFHGSTFAVKRFWSHVVGSGLSLSLKRVPEPTSTTDPEYPFQNNIHSKNTISVDLVINSQFKVQSSKVPKSIHVCI